MSALTSQRTYRALALFQAGDTVACAIPLPFIVKAFDDLGVPENLRRIVPPVKAASAVGLLSVSRFPWLARLTTAMLTVYFVSGRRRARPREGQARQCDSRSGVPRDCTRR